ncbi:MAG TPA: type II secretion system minor pseudopilin GspI [Steroidobacteraceae bacterium]|jgi:general secretion pathway protein I|nr:type II secretion system minor pseudopilin GspI [Steroidobacteraceae bacterium]
MLHTRNISKESAPKGFTLIEVLAALIIVGLGMLAVIRAVNQTINNTNYLREKAIAHWVAMNKLTDVRLSMSPPSNGSSDGDVDMAGIAWRWRMTVSELMPGLKSIEIKVAPKDAGADASMDTINGTYGTAFSPSSPAMWDYNSGIGPGGNPNNPQNPGNQTPGPINPGSQPNNPAPGPVPGPLR